MSNLSYSSKRNSDEDLQNQKDWESLLQRTNMSNLNLYIKIFVERFFTVRIFREMTENDITQYIVPDYNMQDGHKYCMLQLLRLVKNNQDQNSDLDSNNRNSKTIPDLKKSVHLVKDDKRL